MSIDIEQDNRRKYARLDTSFIVEYKKKNSDKWKEAIGLNVSLGGVCFCLSEKLKKNEEIDLKLVFAAEDEKNIDTSGKVMWRTDSNWSKELTHMIGAEFKEISKINRSQFEKIVFSKLFDYVGLPDWPGGKSI